MINSIDYQWRIILIRVNLTYSIMKPFIFFDLGQTLIDEWNYINYFDKLLFETLNGYGAKIDYKNYFTLRNNILITRIFCSSFFLNIVSFMANLILPKCYDLILFYKLKDYLLENKKKLIKLH